MERTKLQQIYYDPKRVGSYGGVAALRKVVPEYNVEQWLSVQDAYTLHKPVRRHFKRRCVVVGGPNQQWQGFQIVSEVAKTVRRAPIFDAQRRNEGEHRREVEQDYEDTYVAIFHEEPVSSVPRRPTGLYAIVQRNISPQYRYGSVGGEWHQSGKRVETVIWSRRWWHTQVPNR